MAHVYPGVWKTAAEAEGLKAPDAKRAVDAAGPLIPSIVLWAQDPAQTGGFDEAGLRAAFPDLGKLDDPQTRAVMRVTADLVDGTFVP